MQAQIGPRGFDRDQHLSNFVNIAVPFADRPDANPGARRQPAPVLPDVVDVLGWRVALKHRHHGQSARVIVQRVVARDRQPLVVGDGEAHAGQPLTTIENIFLAHVILCDDYDLVAQASDAPGERGVLRGRQLVVAVQFEDTKCLAVKNQLPAAQRLLPRLQSPHVDAAVAEMLCV